MSISAIRQTLNRSRGRGQSLLIAALMLTVLIGVVGLAVDGAISYTSTVSIERAVAAASLAGVPYLPANFNTVTPSATSRAQDEAKRNGYDPAVATCRCTVSVAQTNNNRNLKVTITQVVPTFFLRALGQSAVNISRTAEAGYRPPIRLGSPDNQFGSTVSQIGTAGQFYILRQKAWHVGAGRGEGDAYTPDPSPPYEGAQATTDFHDISANNGNESTAGGVWPGKDPTGRGGQNFRITIPPGTTGELQVYNAGFAPDKGAASQNNPCENTKGRVSCNANPAQNLSENDGNQLQCAAPPAACASKAEYNAIGYSLFQVNDENLRANDGLMLQDTVYPIDASNYAANPPTYVNVHTPTLLTQTYVGGAGAANGALPSNMRSYHSWVNLGDPQRDSVEPVIATTGYSPTATGGSAPISCAAGNKCPALTPGTYRLRVDMLNADGTVGSGSTGGSSNHGYALRIVNPNTPPSAGSAANVCVGTGGAKCTVSGMEDVVLFTPLTCAAGGPSCDNYIPIFQLPSEYAGSTINVDLFDFGDVSNSNNVSIIDPTATGNCSQTPYPPCGGVAHDPGNNLLLTNNGHDRDGGPAHICGGSYPNSQCPSGNAPAGPNDVTHLIGSSYASWCVAGCPARPYNGTWIRATIPIGTGCPTVPVAGCYGPTPGNDFWYVQYHLAPGTTTGDTFTLAVAAQGGPVHLISS